MKDEKIWSLDIIFSINHILELITTLITKASNIYLLVNTNTNIIHGKYISISTDGIIVYMNNYGI